MECSYHNAVSFSFLTFYKCYFVCLYALFSLIDYHDFVRFAFKPCPNQSQGRSHCSLELLTVLLKQLERRWDFVALTVTNTIKHGECVTTIFSWVRLLLSQAAGSVPVATSHLTVFSRLLHLTVGNAQFLSFGHHWKRGSLSVTIS